MSEGESEEADDWSDYDSGPFCRHWHDPSDCEEVCATCGHTCAMHGMGVCGEGECQCSEFSDEQNDETPATS